jgi:hypothetical protein
MYFFFAEYIHKHLARRELDVLEFIFIENDLANLIIADKTLCKVQLKITLYKKKKVMIDENSKDQKEVSVVNTVVGEDDGPGGGTVVEAPRGDTFGLLPFLLGEIGDLCRPLPLT